MATSIMDAIALHLEVRNALSLSDELGRHQHALGNDTFAGHLSAVRSLLGEIERELGRSHETKIIASPATIERLEHCVAKLRGRDDEIPAPLKPRIGQLLAALDRVVFAESRPDEQVPAKKLFDALPLARVIPQDVHSVLDYVSAAGYFASAKVARTTRGRLVGTMLGAKVAGVSAVTDYRLSLAKVVPIELHECFDYLGGFGAVSAPFVLGYVRKDPIASLLQIGAGLATVIASLFTDYRADKGVGRALRSRGGPAATRQPREARAPRGARTAGKAAQRSHASARPNAEGMARQAGAALPAKKLPARPAPTGPSVTKVAKKASTSPVADVAIVKGMEPLSSPQPARVASEAQRPLEGLAGPSALPSLDELDSWAGDEPVSR